MTSSDDLFYSIVDDISRYTRSNYERILVKLGMYSLHQLHDPGEGYVKILSKKEFILTTLEEKGFEPLIDTLIKNDMLSPETIKLLEENGYKTFEEQKATLATQKKSFGENSKIAASVQPETPSKKVEISDNSPNKVKHSNQSWKVPTVIIVAIIGCAGTFITALFGYLAIKSQIEIPIRTTQTSEAIQKDLTANAPVTVTPTEVKFTPTPNVDWNSIFRASLKFPMCDRKVIPDYIFINPSDMQLSVENFSTEFAKQNGQDWNSGIATRLYLELGSSSQLEWVKVENRFYVNVIVDSNVPDNPNIVTVWGCGGGNTREFSEVGLDNQGNLSQYKVKLEYPEIDFFTLQPGEFESFMIPLVCKAPGIYSVTLDMNLEYIGQPLVYTVVPTTKVYCPYSYFGYS